MTGIAAGAAGALGPAVVGDPRPLLAVLGWPPDLQSAEWIAVAGGILLGAGGVRYLLKRRRRSKIGTTVDASDLLEGDVVSKSGPGTTVRTAATAVTAHDEGQVIKQTAHGTGAKKNVAFTLPSFLPLSQGVREVTHDEVHSIELGVVVGLLTAWLFSTGRIELTVSILAVFVAGALGYKRYRTKAFKTVRHEPWYALVSFGIGAGLGYVAFVAGI